MLQTGRPSGAKEKEVTFQGNSDLQGIVCQKGLSSSGGMGVLNFLTYTYALNFPFVKGDCIGNNLRRLK